MVTVKLPTDKPVRERPVLSLNSLLKIIVLPGVIVALPCVTLIMNAMDTCMSDSKEMALGESRMKLMAPVPISELNDAAIAPGIAERAMTRSMSVPEVGDHVIFKYLLPFVMVLITEGTHATTAPTTSFLPLNTLLECFGLSLYWLISHTLAHPCQRASR